MLDQFLKVALAAKEKNDTRQEMVESFMKLPNSELHKIATGKLKLSCMMDSENDWLGKFEGTPLYDQALALEEEKLELDVQGQQQRLAENEERRAKSQERDVIWDQQDAIRLKKRLLELELRKSQLGGGAEGEEGPEEEAEEEAEGMEAPTGGEEEAPEKLGSVDYFYRQRAAALHAKGERMKLAADMDPSRAYGLTEDELMEAASGGGKMKKMRARAAEHMTTTQQGMQGSADYAAAHPVAHRVPGALLGGTAGGLGGAAIGHAIKPGLGTAVGGLGGAALGGAAGYFGTPSPESKAQSAQEYAQAVALMGGDKKLMKSGLRKALLEQAMQTDEMGMPMNPEAVEALRKHIAPKLASVKTAGTWADTSPYALGHTFLNPLPGSGYGATAGGLMASADDQSPALKGALVGGGMGGAAYGLKGLQYTQDPRSAAILAGIGAIGGATGGAHTGQAVSQKMKARKGKKKESMVKVAHDALEKCAAERYDALTGQETLAIYQMSKAAEARMGAGLSFDELEDFEKVAIFGAMAKGLSGAGKFLRGTAKGAKNVYKKGVGGTKGGWGGGGRSGSQTWTEGAAGSRGQGLKNIGGYLKARVGTGAKRVGQFAKDNPGAAAALGGAGLATAGGIGYAAS
jgi:hypothetical protein